jgi:hypothetical protein
MQTFFANRSRNPNNLFKKITFLFFVFVPILVFSDDANISEKEKTSGISREKEVPLVHEGRDSVVSPALKETPVISEKFEIPFDFKNEEELSILENKDDLLIIDEAEIGLVSAVKQDSTITPTPTVPNSSETKEADVTSEKEDVSSVSEEKAVAEVPQNFPVENASADKKMPVVVNGDEISYLQGEGKVIARGNVTMTQNNVKLFCEEGIFDVNANIAYIKGNVKVIRDKTILYGKDVIYNFNKDTAELIDIRIEDPPIYGVSGEAEKLGKDKYILRNGYVSTCDLKDPHYRLISKQITIYPQDKVIANNVVLKVGKMSLLYIPRYTQSLKDKTPPMEIVPGKSKDYGIFALGRWFYSREKENKGTLLLDWYEKRGWGIGATQKVESKDFGQAFAKYYSLKDKMYELDKRNSLFDLYPDRKNIDPKYLENNRYRADLSYQTQLYSKLSVITQFHKFSDNYFIKDFFEREYDINPNPLSYILASYPFSNSSLSLLMQKRVNRFQSQTEYLPQLEYNFFKQELGLSKFYIESDNKLGTLTYKRAYSGLDEDAARLYSHDTLSYVGKVKWIKIIPYAGAYGAFYSKNAFGDHDIWRLAPEMGATLNTDFYKIFDKSWKLLGEGIDKMRHVLTPEVTYSYIHDPTVSNNNIFQFDSDDSLAREEKVVFALKNKLQLKNKKRTWDFVYFSPSFEYMIHPEGHKSYFSTINADLEVYPKDWLALKADSSYDVPTRRFSSFNADFSIQGRTKVFEDGKEVEKEKYSFSYGQRYTRTSSTQGTLGLRYQFTPKLQYKGYARCEYNTGDILEQQHSIRFDLHCWWMDLGLDIDKQEEGVKDSTVWVIFTLKDFPDIRINFDHGYKATKRQY